MSDEEKKAQAEKKAHAEKKAQAEKIAAAEKSEAEEMRAFKKGFVTVYRKMSDTKKLNAAGWFQVNPNWE